MKFGRFMFQNVVLPGLGIAAVFVVWAILSATVAKDLPSPLQTWNDSKLYIMEPFAYRGEMDQGILRFTWLSLRLVAKGYALALLLGVPLGFMLGLSVTCTRIFDPIFQILRPVSPLA
ncbi:MAG: nitrate ABC transporter, permease protein, partial [Phycisphaerae bacterium]